jgi:cytochrome c1
MVFALSTGHQIGLAGTGAAFIVFSLVSSFVLPRSDPDFPGRRRNAYLVLTLAIFAAMMAAVVVFGREKKESKAEAAPGTTTPAHAQPAADVAAGKTLFMGKGCVSCHTFKPAGSKGTVGPDLDNLKESAAAAKQPLDRFIATSITDPNAYIAKGYNPGIMPTFKFTDKEVSDLVAFLTSGS